MPQATSLRRHPTRTTPLARSRGLTLVECAVTTAVVALAAGTALPGLTQMRTNQVLAQAAGGFETDVQHARSMAVATQTPWRIGFGSGTAGSCYVVYSGPAAGCSCDGAGQAVCTGGAESYRTVPFTAGSVVSIQPNVASISFDPVKGTSTPSGTARFIGQNGAAVHQVVNIMGRVRSCSPGAKVPGYKAC
jgi:type IV fimbrial biogenesis protein FimT